MRNIIYLFFVVTLSGCVSPYWSDTHHPIQVESSKVVEQIDVVKNRELKIGDSVKKSPKEYHLEITAVAYEENITRKLREFLITAKTTSVKKEQHKEAYSKYLIYALPDEKVAHLQRDKMKINTGSWQHPYIDEYNFGSYNNKLKNYVSLKCNILKSKSKCGVFNGNYAFADGKGNLSFSRQQAKKFSSMATTASNYAEIKKMGFNLWDKVNYKLSKDKRTYSYSKSKEYVDILKSIKVEGISSVPKKLHYKVNYKKNGKAILKLIFKTPAFAFSRDAKAFGIDQEYGYLIPDFVKKKTMKLKVVEGKDKKTHKVIYYDATELFTEIDRLKSLGRGYIRLTANMVNVDVYIDGVRQGGIKDKKPFVAKLIEGRHRIQVKKDFFGSKAISVMIEPDDAFAYHFDLKPSGNLAEEMGQGKIVQSTGQLVVVTSRNDLSVLIDGQTRVPPFKLPNISSGMHKMRIKGPSGDKTVVVTVNENQKSLVDLDKLY